MTKTLVACATAASLAAAVMAPTSAHAGRGGALAAGILGGLAIGAIIGSAAANSGPYYSPAPVYGPMGCQWQRQRVWDGYSWRWIRERVCY